MSMKTTTALDDLLSAVESDQPWQTLYRLACDHLRDDPASASSPGVAAALAVLAGYPGWGGRLRSMRTILANHKATAAGEPAYVPLSPASDGLTGILRDRGLLDAPDGLDVPAGYDVREGQIIRDDRLVARRLVAVVGRARDAETHEGQLTLAWEYDGGWMRSTVPRSVVSDARQLVAMSLECLPVDSTTASEVVAWLRDQEHAARELPSMVSMARLGWLPDGSAFLLGQHAIGGDVILQTPGEGERDHAAGYTVAGTEDGWRSTVWPLIAPHPAGLVALAAFAAPLLDILDAAGWTLDIGGETSVGKTTALRAAASIYGQPKRLVTPWPKTWAAAREMVTYRSHLPVFADDTKNLGGDWKIAKELVYSAADRLSQSLGSAKGGTRRQRIVRVVLISTGEAPLALQCGDARGAMARMLSIGSRLWPADRMDLVRSIHPAVAAQHGAIGRGWIRYLHTRRDLWPAWRQAYAVEVERLSKDAPDEVSARLAHYVAHLHITATLLRRGMGLDVPDALLSLASRLAEEGAGQRDVPRAAWDAAAAYGASRPSQWHGVEHAREPYLGVHGTGYSAWWPAQLRDALEDSGYAPEEILASWRSRGWLETDEPSRTTTRVRVAGDRPRMIKLLWHGLDREPGPPVKREAGED